LSIIYLFIHAGQTACVGEAKARGIRARNYLVQQGLSPERIVVRIMRQILMGSHWISPAAVVRLVASIVFAVAPVFSQTQNKVIEWSTSPIGSNHETARNLLLSRQIDGVEIEDMAVDGKSIIVGEPFAAGDDWLKTFTVRLKNISGQRLVSAQITLVLPEMGVESPDIVFCYGCVAIEKEQGFMPGEVVELKMPGGGFYDWVRSRIAEKGSVSRINKAEIRQMYVRLPSGPTWSSGCIKTANPRNACRPNGP
jgi:hypothetical protein